MLNASVEYRQRLAEDKRNFLGYVTLNLADGTALNLTNAELWSGGIKIEDAVSGDSEFQIGAAIINKLTLTINNMYDDFSAYDFTDVKATVQI